MDRGIGLILLEKNKYDPRLEVIVDDLLEIFEKPHKIM